MSAWEEWPSETESTVWCRGWSVDRESLALALYRLGYLDNQHSGGLIDGSGIGASGSFGSALGLAEDLTFYHWTISVGLLDELLFDEAPFAQLHEAVKTESTSKDADSERLAITVVPIGLITPQDR